MAQMFPDLTELELKELEKKSSAETDVYRAFRDKTPADWLVLHGLNLIFRSAGGPPRDAEADFVVFDVPAVHVYSSRRRPTDPRQFNRRIRRNPFGAQQRRRRMTSEHRLATGP